MSPAEAGGATTRPRLLLVDDNAVQLRIERLRVEESGYRVLTAADGREALRMAHQRRPDIVLSDVMMSGLDGFDLCRALRADPATASIPVVLVSGLYGEPGDVGHAVHCGANMFVCRASGLSAIQRALRVALKHPDVRLEPQDARTLDTEHRECLLRQVPRISAVDPLTGLLNRAAFLQRAEQAAADAARGGAAAGLLLLSLGNFRDVNDTLGAEGGDQVLLEAARRLQEFVAGSAGICARLGGARFGVLMPRLPNAEWLAQSADTLQVVMGAPVSVDGIPVEMVPHMGSARIPEDALQVGELLRRADVALDHARTRHLPYVAYTSELDPFSLPRLMLVSELRSAIAQDQFELWYQPKLDLTTGRVDSVEALVRWRHPVRGLICPDQFIAAAEQTGMIHLITTWVLKAALEQARDWADRGLHLNVAINISQVDLHDAAFLTQVLQALAVSGVAAQAVTLELTETTAMRDPRRTAQVLEALRRHGLRIALDDFGTGHASLAHLHCLPIDEIKLDKSFVQKLPDANSRSIASATAVLAREFGLKSVAEGVESAANQQILLDLGFDCVQGFGLSKPLPPGELEVWIGQRQARRMPAGRGKAGRLAA